MVTRPRPAIAAGLLLAWSLSFTPAAALAAAPPVSLSESPSGSLSGQEIVRRVENLLWGKTSVGRYRMRITTPHWRRTLELRVWMDRPEKTFIRILAPPKEAGIGSLRIGSEMWNYLPKVERIVKIPPSMMLQPWMGSHFTNDDLVKESSMVHDYTHTVLAEEERDGVVVYVIESLPKPEAAVVWGKLVYEVRRDDLIPLRLSYYDERGRLVKVLTFSEVREMDGRRLPTRWEMRPVDEPGNATVIEMLEVRFDVPIDAGIFTLRHLRSGRR